MSAFTTNQQIYQRFLDNTEIAIEDMAKRFCDGCQNNHPSQWQHQCVRMDSDEKIVQYTDMVVSAMDQQEKDNFITAVLQSDLLTKECGYSWARYHYFEYFILKKENHGTKDDENEISSTTTKQ